MSESQLFEFKTEFLYSPPPEGLPSIVDFTIDIADPELIRELPDMVEQDILCLLHDFFDGVFHASAPGGPLGKMVEAINDGQLAVISVEPVK